MMLLLLGLAETSTKKHEAETVDWRTLERRPILHLIKRIHWTPKQKAEVCFAELLLHEVTALSMRTW